MSWHYGEYAEAPLFPEVGPTRDGTEREPVHGRLAASVRPAAAFCEVPDCGWSAVWEDEAGAAGLAMAHVVREHGGAR